MFGVQMLVDAALRFAQIDPTVVQTFVARVMREAPQMAAKVSETASSVKIAVEAMDKSLGEIDARLLRIERHMGIEPARSQAPPQITNGAHAPVNTVDTHG